MFINTKESCAFVVVTPIVFVIVDQKSPWGIFKFSKVLVGRIEFEVFPGHEVTIC